ncbi:hypothetical protein LEM8419_02379 [Neolewinella maritima]|uniref:Sulfatase-modifying factor enzyme-like domain-containing protein n=1 Tax=Neolewinella maritima TaxID=1383882 RepID=A0ABM9B2P1_9BACT|nr:SUMF1/EgtB/PvdO family nonheme iron enzyme [Neolewinella maritima]CAH1001476.1 hypothetical protein LEM8419_02379 [Neolewinella maritima]
MKTYLLLLGALMLLCGSLAANNITVSNARVIAPTDYTTADIAFDLSWDNSWRLDTSPNNWDAAWVFAKYRVDGGPWQHVTLGSVSSSPTDVTVELMDNKGAMIYHSVTASGTASFTDVRLAWDVATDGYDGMGLLDLQVFAIEMVYVPEGAYSLGTGPDPDPANNEVDEFYTCCEDRLPYVVADAGAILVDSVAGALFFNDTEDPNATVSKRPALRTGSIPAAFPEGFSAFYLMKYEMSQQQWVEFYNTLTPSQRTARNISVQTSDRDNDGWRNRVDTSLTNVASTTNPFVPVGYLSQNDMYTYLDWAALRPMTELEYEKAARGTAAPLNREYAWGTTASRTGSYVLSNKGASNETVQGPTVSGTVRGNATLGTTDDTEGIIAGPLRCGIFAASIPTASRLYAGASFYGIMELSGNQWESVVVMTSLEGRAFTNTHGDGTITSQGLYDVATWPTTRNGVGFKGGRADNGPNFGRVSDRTYTTLQFSTANSRYKWLQTRGVRGL